MAGLNNNTKLLLHFDGADAATTTTDAAGRHTPINFVGNAQLDTSNKKWGTASLELDGTGDSINIADSADWDLVASTSDNWTIDLQVQHDDHVGNEYYITHFENDDNQWAIYHSHGTGLRFYFRQGAVTRIWTGAGEITDTNFHHVSLCKVGSEYGVYKDGVQVSFVDYSATTDTFTGSLHIGQGSNDFFFDGRFDEPRVQKSNIFSASPNVGLTDTITVPTGAYGKAPGGVGVGAPLIF